MWIYVYIYTIYTCVCAHYVYYQYVLIVYMYSVYIICIYIYLDTTHACSCAWLVWQLASKILQIDGKSQKTNPCEKILFPSSLLGKISAKHPPLIRKTLQIDGKVRSDMFYPAGFMDVVSIESWRLLRDSKAHTVESMEKSTYMNGCS